MSTEVDTRIVEMKFDNKDFEKKSQETLSLLDKLKAKLNFDDTKEKMNAFDTSKMQKELSKINDFDSSKMESVFDKLEYRMSNMGIFTARIVENIADDIYNVVKKAMDGIGKVVTFAEQGIVQGGYNRAANIQSAKFQLEGLGIKWEEIYGDIDYAVTNTAYSLDQAAIVASQLASSGIKPGTIWKNALGKEEDIDQMAMILRAISGTASATGGKAGYADIGRIFTKMISYGKVYTSQLNELGTYGIGAKGIVAEYLSSVGYKGKKSWTEQDVADVMSDRKGGGLDPYIVMEAFFNKFAEHATAANETLTGVTANLRAALARIGEKFFEPIIANGGPLVQFLDALRKSVNDLAKAINPAVEALGKFVANGIAKITDKLFNYDSPVYETDEEGKIKKDKNGNPIQARDEEGNLIYERKFKVGGIFSDFLKPWKEGEWIETNITNADHIPTTLPTAYYQEYETRAQKIAENLKDTVKNITSIITGIGKLFGAAFKGATDGGFSLAAILVKITGLLAKITGTISDFVNGPEFVNSGIYLFFRFLADSVRILISFGKSVATHIIKPIFSAGKAAAEASGVGSWFRDLLDKIHKFSENLKKEGNEDYFGPFLEKVKDFFKKIKDTITNGFNDIVDWWKPVKDIIFNSDLGFGEKISAIKQYFSENFELPGWNKAKDIFNGIGDAVGKAWNAIKNFFGFGSKSNKQLTDSAAGLSDEYELVADKINFYDRGILSKDGGGAFDFLTKGGLFGNNEDLEKAEKSTNLLTKIADGIKSFFGSIKDAFASVDLPTLQIVGYGILAVVVALAVGIAWVTVKIIKAAIALTTALPQLIEGLVKSITGVFTELSGLFKAEKFAAYSKGIKDLAIGVSILTATFAILALLVELIEYVGGDKYVDNLRTAGIILGVVTGVLGGLVLSMMAIGNKAASATLALDLVSKKLNIVKPGSTMEGVAKTLRAIVAGVLVLTAAAVLMQFVDWDVLAEGLLKLAAVGAVLLIATRVLMGFAATTSEAAKGTNGVALSGSMAAIAAIITALVVGLVVLTPLLVILALIPTSVFWKGYRRMWAMVGILEGMFAGLVAIMSLGVRIGKLDSKTMTGSMLGLAAVIASIAIALPALVGAMWFISKLSVGQMTQGFIGLAVLAGILVGIPALLLSIFGATEEGKNVKARNIAAVTLPILAIGAAVVAMSYGLKILATQPLDKMIAAMIGIGAFLVGFIFILDELKDMDATQLKLAAITIGMIGGVVLALSLVTFVFAKLLESQPDKLFTAVAIVFGELALLGAAVVMINKVVGNNTYYNALTFAKSMLALSVALIPVTVALVLLMTSLQGIHWGTGLMALSMLVIAMGTLAIFTDYLVGGKIVQNTGNINNLIKAVVGVAAGVAIIGAVLAGMLAIIGAFDIRGGTVLASMLGFGAVMVAFGYTIKLMVDSLSNAKDASKMIGPLLMATLGFVIPMMTIAATLGILVNVIQKSGISTGKLISTAAIIVAMALIPVAMLVLSSKFSGFDDNQIKALATYVVSMVGVALALGMCGNAIAKVAKIPVGQMTTATLCIGAMALAIAACVKIMSTIYTNRTLLGSVSMLVQFVGIGAGLYLVALVLKKVASINFDGMASKLLAMGAVVVVAVAIAALFGMVPSIGDGALEAAALLLGVAGTLAGIGIFLVLSAEALNIFTDTILELTGKEKQISDGLSSLLIGLLDGFKKFWEELNQELPGIFTALEATITMLLHHLHEVIKSVLIEIADFVNDPEVQSAVSRTITGLLDFLIDNAEAWASRLTILAGKIVSGIIKAIDLNEIGKFIDEQIAGGAISNTIDWVVNLQYKVELSDTIDEATTKFWDSAKKIFTSETGLGYSSDQWDQLRSLYASEINGLVQTVIEAEVLGNKEMHNWLVKNFNNPTQFFGEMLEYYAKQAGMVPVTGMDNALTSVADKLENTKDKIIGLTMGGEFKLSDFFAVDFDTTELEKTMTSAMQKLREAQKKGWNTEEGQRLIKEAEAELRALAEKCDDEGLRNLIFEYMKELGMQVPEGFDSGLHNDKYQNSFEEYIDEMKKAIETNSSGFRSKIESEAKLVENAYKTYYQAGTAAEEEFKRTHGGMTPAEVLAQLDRLLSTYGQLENIPTVEDVYAAYRSNPSAGSAAEREFKKTHNGMTPQEYEKAMAQYNAPKPTNNTGNYHVKAEEKVVYPLPEIEPYQYDLYERNGSFSGYLDYYLGSGKITDKWTKTTVKRDNFQEYEDNLKLWVESNQVVEKWVDLSIADKERLIKYLDQWGTDFETLSKVTNGVINASVKDGEVSFTTSLATMGSGRYSSAVATAGSRLTNEYVLPFSDMFSSGFAGIGQRGNQTFATVLSSTGQVLGATRSQTEAGIYSNYINPLMAYMSSYGTLTGDSYIDSLLLIMNSPIAVRPRITVEPVFDYDTNKEIQKAQSSYYQAGTAAQTYYAQNTKSSLEILRDKVAGYIKNALNFGENTSSMFRISGEMVTAGIAYGMQDKESRNYIGVAAKTVSQTVRNHINKAFRIESPAKEMYYTGEMITAGTGEGMTDSAAQSYMQGSANAMASNTESSIDSALAGMDLGSIASKVGSSLKEKLPSMSDVMSNFGLEKGLSGNLQGVKNVWNQLKDSFSDGIDFQGILKDAGFDISAITSSLGIGAVSLEDLGFSISAGGGLGSMDLSNEFSTFDINDIMTDTDLNVNLDLDTSLADDWLKQNTSIDMATSVPVTGGYERSTTGGPTYVNNYSFNQNNTSPQALSARDTARYADLMLRRAGGWRKA